MSKLINIVRSRFIQGESLPDWYEKRLEICASCTLNSKNIDKDQKTSGRKAWELIAGAHCTDPTCGCTISEKAKIDTEFCPIKKWLSVRQEEEAIISSLHKITNMTPSKVKIAKEGLYFSADLGELKYGEDSTFELKVEVEGASKVTSKGSCGCLETTVIPNENDYTFKVKYNTNLLGKILGKTVKFLYVKSNIRVEITFLIKGNVSR
ncbi:hypothetical protein Phi17218_073 [Cellulophaga phage phi17:2_18]|uniref:Uncharacterized protein n=2 Tax=Lightbulbvirus Cba172 TaxID=1918525 RepID=R9ZWY2_9CAUD|nr:hypothetical protein Phi17:2_gp073 [Cellulophaga phage phi17:2]AGO47606.1 hypothetical protein Phi17:2_gp073 [Cellulophaga phage phi17:2]ALO80476.1 hypothetical protein Phi17218_073 [Cellulophaga phage phi17:2_18]